MNKLGPVEPLRAINEAGPTGYVIYLQLTKVNPVVQTDSGVEIVRVFSGLTGAVASSKATAPPVET